MSDQLTAAFYITKGGVGKTTSCAHIARALAREYDCETLAVDLAGQQNDLAMQFGLLEEIEATEEPAPVSAVFSDNWGFIRQNIVDVVDRMTYDAGGNLDVIPSDSGLEGADNDLASVPVEDRFTILREFGAADLAGYDAVLYDLPGKENNIALNGLAAAEHVVTPIKPGAFEREQLAKLPTVLERIAGDTPVDADLRYVLPNAVDRRKTVHREFLDHLSETYPDRLSTAVVPNSADVEAAPSEGCTVFEMPDLYDTGERARDAYATAAAELLKRLT